MEHSVQPPIVEFQGVSVRYGHIQALREIDLVIGPSEVVALLGDNGAGKSTIAKTMMGIIQPHEGRILVNGRLCPRLTPSTARREGMLCVHQDVRSGNLLSIWRNLFLGAELRAPGSPFLAKRKMMNTLLRTLQRLNVSLGKPPQALLSTLTAGKRQLFEIVRAYYFRSSLAIFDEATSSLSREDKKNMDHIVAHLRARRCAILFAAHKVQDVYAYADRFVILYNGRIGIVVNKGDVTERDIEKMLISSHLATVKEMSGSIIHQIRNPLAAIKVSAQVLREELAADPQNRDLAGAAGRLLNHVDTIDLRIDRFFRQFRDIDEPPGRRTRQPLDSVLDAAVRKLPQDSLRHVRIVKRLYEPKDAYPKVDDQVIDLVAHFLLNIIDGCRPEQAIELTAYVKQKLCVDICFRTGSSGVGHGSGACPPPGLHGRTGDRLGTLLFRGVVPRRGPSIEVGSLDDGRQFVRLMI